MFGLGTLTNTCVQQSHQTTSSSSMTIQGQHYGIQYTSVTKDKQHDLWPWYSIHMHPKSQVQVNP
jgi:hypothetical protein